MDGVPLCPACRATNPDGNRFCGQCGRPLVVTTCPACGASNAAHQPFCGQCGLALGTDAARTAPVSVEERKLATVLFADVVGFTSLAERTDPEVVARMVDAAFGRLAEVVVEHGGTVDKYMGDCLMAVFGVRSPTTTTPSEPWPPAWPCGSSAAIWSSRSGSTPAR